MSFSSQVKKEICAAQVNNPCCVQASCYGIACCSRQFGPKGLVLHTERSFIAQWAKAMFAQMGIQGRVYAKGQEHSRSYEFVVNEEHEADKMLAAFGHSGDETALRIKRENLVCSSCFSCFLGAAFLCLGTVVNPEKGYNLEFVSSRYSMMRDLEQLLQEHNFTPGRTVRKGANVLYFKASEQIEDLLTTMGAANSTLALMKHKIYKDLRNRANRITNCETANIDKIIAANQRTMQSIQLLRRHGMLGTLPDTLQEAAALRLRYPDLSLAELAGKAARPVSKSGMSHRYRKLNELAQSMATQPNTPGKARQHGG